MKKSILSLIILAIACIINVSCSGETRATSDAQDTTKVQKLQTAEEYMDSVIFEMEQFEDNIDKTYPKSCFADAIDYDDLYTLRDMYKAEKTHVRKEKVFNNFMTTYNKKLNEVVEYMNECVEKYGY